MTTLRQLTYLVALADERHFRKAATRVHVTQPTLSTQLRELERSLGALLVDRTSKTVSLTPLGDEIVARARKVLAEVKDIEDLASSSQHGFYGTVRVGVPPTLGPYLLPHVVPRLHSTYPELKLYVREAKPDDLVGELSSGQHDFIITPLPVSAADLVVEPLFREPLLAISAPDHPLAARKRVTRADLRGEHILTIEPGHHLHDRVRQICDDFGAILQRDYEGTSLDTLRLMVGMGVGIAFLPALYVRSEIGTRREVAVLDLVGTNLHRQFGLAWRKGSTNESLCREVAALVRSIGRERLSEIEILG